MMNDAELAWERISEAWLTYCHGGAASFDWDYDSRPLMVELTGHRPFEYVEGCEVDPS